MALAFARELLDSLEPADRAALDRVLKKLTERSAKITTDLAKRGRSR